MRLPQQNILALTAVLWTSQSVLAADAPAQTEPRYVEVAMTFDNGQQPIAHTAIARAGEPVIGVFTQNDQQIKIEYVIDYEAQEPGVGHIQSKTQSAAIDSDEWTTLSNFSATFLDGHEVYGSNSHSDGTHFTLAFTAHEVTSPTVAQK